MAECDFQSNNNQLVCSYCGWIAAEPTRRNCSKSPQGIAGRIINLEAEAKAQYNKFLYRRDHYELTRLVTVCLDCNEYDGRCNVRDCGGQKCGPRFPDGCTGRRQWLKALSSVGFRECPKWEENKG